MFHVEHLFADAETPEKSVEHLLNAGPPTDPIERDAGLAQMFSR